MFCVSTHFVKSSSLTYITHSLSLFSLSNHSLSISFLYPSPFSARIILSVFRFLLLPSLYIYLLHSLHYYTFTSSYSITHSSSHSHIRHCSLPLFLCFTFTHTYTYYSFFLLFLSVILSPSHNRHCYSLYIVFSPFAST